MIRTQIQIKIDQMNWLKPYALKNGISMAQAIRDSIDLYRSHAERSGKLSAGKQKALTAVGKFSSE